MDKLVGKTLGDFRVDELIGRGSVGRVYAATQLSLRRRVALKVLEEGLFTPDEFKVRFQREAEVIAALEHPNIVPIYAFGQEGNLAYYAMRFVEGRTLEARIADGLPPREGLKYLADVAAALEYAHGRGVTHRDLKPANILVASGAAMLSDFGLARLAEGATITAENQLLGTPLYMSPEQVRRERAGPAGDRYALGVILYEIATGRNPFAPREGESADYRAILFRRITEGDFAPPDAPEPVSRLILALMAADPESRPSNLRESLLSLVPLYPSAAAPPSVAPAPPPDAEPLKPSEPASAKVFGKFRLLEPLGHGGMGAVFRARQTDLRRDVALKVMNFGPDADETAVRRFKREAQAVALLRHPNIVAVHEAGDIDGRPYFSMDLIEGQSLSAILDKGPLPARRALEIAGAVAAAITHAHAQGVVHRDLKPANVLVDASGHVFVADFGLAKTIGLDGTKLTQSGDIMGTPAYMAPEQARGSSGMVDPRTDVYGMGAILYHMLTGVAPFTGADMYHILSEVVSTDPTPPRKRNEKIHVDAETICLKAMEKDPTRRYKSASDFKADVERFLAGEPIDARPSGGFSKLVKRIRRHPLVAALILVIVAAVATGAGLLIYQQARHARQAQARELTREAAMYYLAGGFPAAEERARRATELDPAWGPGWFWLARVDLRRYAETRGVPAVWVAEGEIEFDPAAEESPAEKALRDRALGYLKRASDMKGWESDFASAVVSFFNEGYEKALTTYERVKRDSGIPDRELDAYTAQAAYFSRDFQRALDLAQEGVTRWGNIESFADVKVNALLALGLEKTLRGEDPLSLYRQAFAAAGDPVLKARALTLEGHWLHATGLDAEPTFRQAATHVVDVKSVGAWIALGDARLGAAVALASRGKIDPEKPVEFQSAVAAYGEAMTLAPAAPAPYLKRALACRAVLDFNQDLGRFADDAPLEGILEDFNRVIAVRPAAIDARIGAANIQYTIRQRDRKTPEGLLKACEEAIDDLERADRTNPRRALRMAVEIGRAWVALGRTKHALGKDPTEAYRRSVDILTGALKLNPRFVPALVQRGHAYRNLALWFTLEPNVDREAANRWEDLALADFDAALASNPRATEAAHAAALLWSDRGNRRYLRKEDPTACNRKAIEYARRALEINPLFVDAYEAWGTVEFNQLLYEFVNTGEAGALERASAAVEKGLDVNPNNAELLATLARLHQFRFTSSRHEDRDALDRAIRAIERAAQINPRSAPFWATRGLFLADRAELHSDPASADRDLEQCTVSFEMALKINELLHIVREHLGLVLITRGVRSNDPVEKERLLRESVGHLKQVRALLPDRADAAAGLGNAASLLGELLDPDSARPFFELSVSAFAAHPAAAFAKPPYTYNYARSLCGLARWKEALDVASRLDPNDPLAAELLKRIREHLEADF